ncbi:MAG: peptide-methionine (R)-S-oxide reductase MsrB [Spirochaetes bacterium]|nr:peptide-methionine (R)-S-oxide reductase MsrB [Spirochaetota bacterium]
MKHSILKTVLVAAVLIFASCAGKAVQEDSFQGALFMQDKLTDAAVCYIEPTEELRAQLTPEQFAVLVENATEPPFRNKYWDNHAAGIYVDAIDGTPLFSSQEKYDSGSGWPSFWQPLDESRLAFIEDTAFGMRRIEVRAKASGGHLGHVFEDGPQPTGIRYCINSASLRFIAKEDLAAAGYAELLPLFSGHSQ